MATKRYLVNGTIQTSMVPDNSSTQRIKVDKGGTLIGTREELNLIEGTGISITATDNSGSDRVDATLAVSNNTTTQKVIVSKTGTTIGTREQINLIEGSNVTLTVADNAGSDRVDVTVAGTTPTNMATKSTAAVTYYVRSDGNDSNDGLASDSGHALLTIQAAIDKLPQFINHAYVVDIGAGNFAGFGMTGRNVNIQGSLNITGALGQVTLGSGHRNSGTGGAGSNTTTLVDTSGVGDWNDNELRGYLLYIPSRGEYRVIRNNTATTINCVGAFGATLNGLAYQIYEQTTVLNSVTSLLNSYCAVFLNNSFYRDSCYVNNIRISPPSGKGGFFCKDAAPQFVRCRAGGTGSSGNLFGFQTVPQECQMNDCYAHDGTTGINFLGSRVRTVTRNYAYNCSNLGFAFQSCYTSGLSYAYADTSGSTGGLYIDGGYMSGTTNVYIDGATAYGVLIEYANYVGITTIEVKNCVTRGIWLASCGRAHVDALTIDTVSGGPGLEVWGRSGFVRVATSCNIANASTYGILVNTDAADTAQPTDGGTVTLTGTSGTPLVIQNNTLGGIKATNKANVNMAYVNGTGNGGYGLRLDEGATAIVSHPGTLTGTSGNATIDSGTNALTWATHFAANGDSITNTDNLCRIVRID